MSDFFTDPDDLTAEDQAMFARVVAQIEEFGTDEQLEQLRPALAVLKDISTVDLNDPAALAELSARAHAAESEIFTGPVVRDMMSKLNFADMFTKRERMKQLFTDWELGKIEGNKAMIELKPLLYPDGIK